MSELKACPFCGGTDNFITVTSNPFSNDMYSTTHCKCYATGPFVAENYLIGEKAPSREHMEERAIEHWNTRQIEDDLRKRIAELKIFIDQLIEAGDAMSNAQSMWVAEEDKWDALVKDWKER